MKEQIRQALKNAPTENLEELRKFYAYLKIIIAKDFEETVHDPEEIATDLERLSGNNIKTEVLISAISFLGCEEIIEIIEDVEEERKEERGI